MFVLCAAFWLLVVVGAMSLAHADQTFFSLACSPMTRSGSLIKGKPGLIVAVKGDDHNYGYAQTNSLDTSKPDDQAFGETVTYFKAQDKNEITLFTTRQNVADIKNPADFLSMKQVDSKTVEVWKMRMKAGNLIGPVDYFYCNFM
ncbi:hypothetical protein MC70_017685 [Serratia marcescens]|uniref:Uncharacterized protein n=2 Tax=Serratia marcescens TaxID=615 RepID=A0AAP8PFH9_SERMA|nr:hypothetical protein MC70_017685 [Serratia marcescens]